MLVLGAAAVTAMMCLSPSAAAVVPSGRHRPLEADVLDRGMTGRQGSPIVHRPAVVAIRPVQAANVMLPLASSTLLGSLDIEQASYNVNKVGGSP